LVAAVAGTAIAADPVATTAQLDKKEKKKVKKIAMKQANKQINQRRAASTATAPRLQTRRRTRAPVARRSRTGRRRSPLRLRPPF
jgi:hypothetical protein